MSLARQVFALAVTAILAIPVVSFAQTERGAISGLVTDETKAAVPGVAIKVINAGTNVATERCLVRHRELHRGKPATGHVSHRSHAARVPDVDRRRESSSPPD